MPLRQYKCNECEHVWEELIRPNKEEQDAPTKCKECGGSQIEEDINGLTPKHQYKGKGFYTNDYKKRKTKFSF